MIVFQKFVILAFSVSRSYVLIFDFKLISSFIKCNIANYLTFVSELNVLYALCIVGWSF